MPSEVSVYVCQECGEESDDFLEEPLYECGSCGTVFTRSNSADGDSHRCPDCGKMSSRISQHSEGVCEQCEQGVVEEESRFECDYCQERFDTESDCQEHEDNQHKDEVS